MYHRNVLLFCLACLVIFLANQLLNLVYQPSLEKPHVTYPIVQTGPIRPNLTRHQAQFAELIHRCPVAVVKKDLAVKVTFAHKEGKLYHHGHLYIDGVLPFMKFFVCVKSSFAESQGLRVYIANETSQILGTQQQKFEDIFSVKVVVVPSSRFTALRYPTWRVPGFAYGPYDMNVLEDFYKHSVNHFKLRVYPNLPKILLIQRGIEQSPFFKMKGGKVDTGANRRHIRNHDSVHVALKERYGNSFSNVELEQYPTVSGQAQLFHSACVVIAQHGSGLMNLVYSRPSTQVFEFGPYVTDAYRRLASPRGIRYHQYQDNVMSTDLNVTKLLADLEASGVSPFNPCG